MTDDERLAKILVDSLREAERIYDEDEDTTNFPKALCVLDRSELAAEKLSDRICRLRGATHSIVAPCGVFYCALCSETSAV